MVDPSLKSRLLKKLFEYGCIKLSDSSKPFHYASGLKGPIYCDNRPIMSYPELRQIVSKGLEQLLQSKGIRPDLLAAMATAGIAPTAFLADRLKLPMVYIRSKPKDHGTKQLIEGFYQEGQKVVLIDDLVNQASSISKGVIALKEAKLKLDLCMSIVDYQMAGARKNLDQCNGPELCALIYFEDIISYLESDSSYDSVSLSDLRSWHKNPTQWP